MALGGNLVLMETVKCFRMTSDKAPEPALNLFQGGGGKNSAPFALLQMPALRPVLNLIQDLFQGRLLLPQQCSHTSAKAFSCVTKGGYIGY